MAVGVGIGASGVIGVAFETTPGTYVAPTKFFPIKSESLKKTQDVLQRRILRGIVDINGTVQGNTTVEGDIEMEAYEDAFVWFLAASRCSVVKTGTNPNYIYTVKGTHNAEPVNGRTLSIAVVRNGVVFGYTGCIVGSQEWSLDDGLLVHKFSIQGMDEAVQTNPTASYTAVSAFGPGMYTYNIAGTATCDMDSISFSINDNATPEHRICSRGPRFLRWGERETTATLERDFIDRTDYDAYLAQTAQSLEFIASKGANNSMSIKIPVAQKDKYEVGLSGQTDLIRASIDYIGVYDATTTAAWEIVVKTQESITVV